MTEAEIAQKIKQIKQLIVDRRFKKAFLILAEIIEEIDRLDKDDVDDVELENKMHLIKSRFNSFNQKSVEGIPTDNAEFNQITMSILNFLDEVKQIAIEYKTNDQAQISSRNLPSPPPETIAHGAAAPPLSERNGCLIAFNNKDTKVNIQMKNFSPAKIILSLGALIVALGLFFFLISGGKGCAAADDDNGGDPSTLPIDSIISKETVALGPDGDDLGLVQNSSAYQMANQLSEKDATFPQSFSIKENLFSKNGTQLTRSAKTEIDNIVTVLKTYPNARFEILGYQKEDEKDPPQTNPKVMPLTLDEERAKSIYQYLKSQGVEESRMNFTGDGVQENKSATLKIWSR